MSLKNKFSLYNLLIIISFIILVFALGKIPYKQGDGHEYYMMAESFVNHGSFNMTPIDRKTVEEKSHKYPYKSRYIDPKQHGGYWKSLDNKLYSWHFFSYSLMTVPAKYILNVFQKYDLRSFQLTNAILFILMIWLLYYKSSLPEKQKNALLLLVIFSPILYYLNWTHPEVYTYVFVVLSLIFYHNKQYARSNIIMAIASWQNPPVIFFSMLVFVVHFFKYIKSKEYKKILIEGITLFPFLFPMIFYYYHYGVPNLIAANGYSSIHFISLDKIFDLYFGLQHGMILFSSIVIVSFIFIVGKKIITRHFTKNDIYYLLSIIVMTLAVTTAPNWNCGMNYILRYATWIYAFIIFYVVINISTQKILFIAYLNTVIFLMVFVIYNSFFYLKFNKLSEFLLSNYPALYITTPDTFAENTLHKEGNFKNKFPIIHQDNDGNIMKVLTDYKGLKQLLTDKRYVVSRALKQKLIQEHKNKKGYFFINLKKGEIVINKTISPQVKNITTSPSLTGLDIALLGKQETHKSDYINQRAFATYQNHLD